MLDLFMQIPTPIYEGFFFNIITLRTYTFILSIFKESCHERHFTVEKQTVLSGWQTMWWPKTLWYFCTEIVDYCTTFMPIYLWIQSIRIQLRSKPWQFILFAQTNVRHQVWSLSGRKHLKQKVTYLSKVRPPFKPQIQRFHSKHLISKQHDILYVRHAYMTFNAFSRLWPMVRKMVNFLWISRWTEQRFYSKFEIRFVFIFHFIYFLS